MGWINTVSEKHPNWDVRLWREDDIDEFKLFNHEIFNYLRHSDEPQRYLLMSDIARYEIIHKFGGFYLDTDTLCLRSFEELRVLNCFAVLENKILVRGLICNGYFGMVRKSRVLANVIGRINKKPIEHFIGKHAWSITGPKLFTDVINTVGRNVVKVLAHDRFLPFHHSEEIGESIKVPKDAFCIHMWGTTKGVTSRVDSGQAINKD
jgi:mannosyltransferase OCH1-like enzyme